ncbi:YobI family P-loop NTPase [Enterococcus avium]|uniref:YobI family P-loop NTPase n=1 Tax=Enterococcus sp. TaxID=35783 RepID=UPI00291337DE|nr:hypothetical protein [Enterococcus sp.]MDU5337168.1 hypothetical protein [Enterococcus sp.]
MNFFSLKPRNKKEEVKNYETYKKALDYCFTEKNEINNIGIIGDYGTGKSTVIGTYVENEIDNNKYDVINISLLTLKNDETDSLILLNNIIKQIVQNPKKDLEHNILKFRSLQLDRKSLAFISLFVFCFLLVFFMNTEVLAKLPVVNHVLNYGIPLEIFKIIQYFLLIAIVVLFILYLYPKLLSGFKISKFNVASTVDAELEKFTDVIKSDEFDYLEYLIYLLRRKNRNLLLIIEDIDRYENIKIFQQLREVNNLLNGSDENNSYKFVYAVGNSLFSEYSKKDKVDINKIYQSDFKDNVTKFFDFAVNITPVMDNQNSYEFIKRTFPNIVSDESMKDEDLFMISQYISSPRVLIDVVNDYQIMKEIIDIGDKEEFSDLKLFYFTILKSRFYNFYEIIHDVFEDMYLITKLYNNKDQYEYIEKKRKEEFFSRCLLVGARKNGSTHISITTLEQLWNEIKQESGIQDVRIHYGESILYNSYGAVMKLNDVLEDTESNNIDYIFSSEEYRRKSKTPVFSSNKSISKTISLYYSDKSELIKGIIKDVENRRKSDPNKLVFSIKDFLDIDFVKLGILENILDMNDYNIYISNNYLEVNDATFIKNFNLLENRTDLYTLKLYDPATILSKMKEEKIINHNGLNVYLISWIYTKKILNSKANKLLINAVNEEGFIYEFLKFEQDVDKVNFLFENISQVENSNSLKQIIDWVDINCDNAKRILSRISLKNSLLLLETDYKEELYRELIILEIADMTEDETLMFIFDKVKNGYLELLNLILDKYENLILEEEEFDNSRWLEEFNRNLNVFTPNLDENSAVIVFVAYKIEKDIKVKLLSDIKNDALLSRIYESNIYEYSIENVEFILSEFENNRIEDYGPYVQYSLENKTSLFDYIEKNENLSFSLEKRWDKAILSFLFSELSDNDFDEALQFMSQFNPIVFHSLNDLNLSFSKLIIFSKYTMLYENSYLNLQYLRESISIEDKEQIEIIDEILIHRDFDFYRLYNNIEDMDQDEQIKHSVYRALFENENVDAELFEKYVKKYDDILETTTEISSIEKLQILYKWDKVKYSFGNISVCNLEILEFLFSEKKETLYSEMLSWNEAQVIQVLNNFEDYTLRKKYLIELLHNEEISIEYSINLISIFLKKSVENEKVDLLVIESINLLNEVQRDEQNIEKLVSMISNKKGQRTVPNDYLSLANLFKEKRLIIYDEKNDKITLRYL